MVTDTKNQIISSTFDEILKCVAPDNQEEVKMHVATITTYIRMLETNHELEVHGLIERIGRLEGMLYDSIRNH